MTQELVNRLLEAAKPFIEFNDTGWSGTVWANSRSTPVLLHYDSASAITRRDFDNLAKAAAALSAQPVQPAAEPAIEALLDRLDDAVEESFEYDAESEGYYDTPLTILLRDCRSFIEALPFATPVQPHAEAVAGLVGEMRHLVSLNEPDKGGPYGGFAAQRCMAAMTKAASTLTSLAAEVEALKRERDEARSDVQEQAPLVAAVDGYAEIAAKHKARADSLASDLAQCREALEKSLPAINATEQIAVIARSGYTRARASETESLKRQVDEFLDLRRSCLKERL